MRSRLLILFSLLLVVFLSGCVKNVETNKIQYKNDVITVENYVVNTLSPYGKETISIEFDVQNNGDQPVYDVKVNFFDIPGFDINFERDVDKRGVQCQKINPGDITYDDKSCIFTKLDSLDARKITLIAKAPDVKYPTSYTVSFSISYISYGARSAIIPIVDGVIKKEPSFKFSQSDPTIGPIIFDIVPMLEREKVVDKKTLKEYWGITDRIFLTKFVMKHVGSVQDKIKPVNAFVLLGSLTNLEYLHEIGKTQLKEKVKPCDFTYTDLIDQLITERKSRPIGSITYRDKSINTNLQDVVRSLIEQSEEFKNILEELRKPVFTDMIRKIDRGNSYLYPNPANETYNTLICNFVPSGTGYEFSATMKIVYFYNYEFIRSETFVVQPRVGFK